MPCTKVPYVTQAKAYEALKSTKKSRERGNTIRQECRVYFCQQCFRYHLSSQRDFKKKRRRIVQRIESELEVSCD